MINLRLGLVLLPLQTSIKLLFYSTLYDYFSLYVTIVYRYCPSCKKPRQAFKKLDLWRLPEILVVHLKRFSYDRYFKNKLETFVDFPVDELDFSTYIAHRYSQLSNCYILYAIGNHYEGLGGGHYTASVHVSGVSSVLGFYLFIFYQLLVAKDLFNL